MAKRTDVNPVQSLSFRLSVSYALTTAVMLAVLSVGMYALVATEFWRDDNQFMDDTVSLLQTILTARDDILEVLHRELPRDLEAFHFNRYQLRLQGTGNELLYTSPHFPPLSAEQLHALNPYPEASPGLAIQLYGSDNRPYLVLAARARLGRQQSRPVVLYITIDNSSKVDTLNVYRNALVLVWLVGTLIAVVASTLIARRGLQPLRTMTATIQRIRFPGLPQRRRISQAHWPSELTGLAQAFDSLLDELEQGVDRLSHFSKDLAHEFRTPLTNIMLQADLLLQSARTPEDYQAGLVSCLEEIERLSTLVERLLFLARMEDRDSLNPQVIAARPVVERVLDLYSASASDVGVELEVEGQAQIEADPTLFEAALSNLLSNALRYTPQGGRIRVGLEDDVRCARIVVADTGKGIAPEHLPFLFDRFYRADRSRTLDGKGFGLGLALVHSIMTVHHGDVKIESEVGRGTRVSLLFPHHPYGNVIYPGGQGP